MQLRNHYKTINDLTLSLSDRYLQNRTRVVVWLYENVNTRIEGQIVGKPSVPTQQRDFITIFFNSGFDEYMNLVLDEATEVHKKGNEKQLGRIMLKGDSITLIQTKDAK